MLVTEHILLYFSPRRDLCCEYISTVKKIGVPRSMHALFLMDIKPSLKRQRDWSLTIWHTIGDILSVANWSAEMDD